VRHIGQKSAERDKAARSRPFGYLQDEIGEGSPAKLRLISDEEDYIVLRLRQLPGEEKVLRPVEVALPFRAKTYGGAAG
jgi:hypothetical protein